MKTSNKILISGFIVILLASLAGILYIRSILLIPAVEGDGNVTEETRSISPFEKIKISGRFMVYYTHSQTPELRIRADKNLHELIQTDIQNQTLNIRFSDPVRSKNDIEVWITNPSLSHLEVHSAAEFRVQNPLSQPQMYIQANGAAFARIEGTFNALEVQQNASSRVVLAGTTDTLTVRSNAAGTVNALEMEVYSAFLSANAAASIHVNAKEIDASANAAGVIYYSGTPAFTQLKMNAGGKIVSN